MRDSLRESAIIIDHLAFSVPLAEMRHLSRCGGELKKYWKSFPKRTWKNEKNNERKEMMIENWQQQYRQVCIDRFSQFLSRIMNLRLGLPRDRGMHGYLNSAPILSPTNNAVLGFVAYGGNNDTIYLQVSGDGCKHVFSHVSSFQLHFWLDKVLSIKKLNRVDLAFDDFIGNFSIEYAKKAYADGAFKSAKGGANPKATTIMQQQGDIVTGHTFAVGSRQSNNYWRIYDKAQEQGLNGVDWIRSEVEMKKVSVDVLINPAKSFAGINAFSSSINLEHGVSFHTKTKKTALEFAGRIRWAKRQVGRTLSDILETLGGDVYQALGLLVDERGGKFSLPDSHAQLLNVHLNEEIKCY
jgi:phage replication initiation protein